MFLCSENIKLYIVKINGKIPSDCVPKVFLLNARLFMCGIVGYVGPEQAAPILLEGLTRLEYRGYDSAGLAVRDGDKKVEVVKAKGRLKVLRDKTGDGSALKGKVGIGHTRWATHGEPSENNAHPHVSDDLNVVAVHNGIIENYTEIKEKLLKKGYKFYSETDTEAIVDGFDDKVDEAKADISNAKTDALNGIGSAKTDALTDINSAKTQAVTDVADEGTRQVDLVTEEGSTQVSAVRTEGQTQVDAVQTEGETQVNAVSTEGGTQITNIEQRGADVLSRIPYFAPIITDTAEGSIASFSDGADDYPMKSVVAEINPIQSGSGDPAPDNVRPISGWSGVNANSTGVNIWDEEWEVGNYNLETGEPNVYANAIRTKGYISVKPSTNYYSFVGNNSFLTRLFYDINKNYISYQSTRNGAFTTPANVHYMRFATQGGGAYGNVYLNDISINYPSTITTYSPYTGQSYSIPFKDSEGNPITVYGGNMNITDGEG